MPGTAIVTINENEWHVSIASTYSELTTGLRGVLALAAGTGMLFILPAAQAPSVDTTGMNFPLDIIFIANNVVIDVARNIEPGYLVTEETPCDSFLEINAGEAADVEAGDTVCVEAVVTGGFDFSSIMSFAIPLATMGFICAMAGGMAKLMGGSSHSSNLGHPSKPEEATFPLEARKDLTFCKHMWDLEKTIGRPFTREEVSERWERWRELRYRPKTEEERRLSHSLKYGIEELPERGKGLESRYSQKEEQVRFIGACKVIGGLCHTHGYSVSKTVRCPKSPLTDEEWAAAWELAEVAYPKGMSNPWVNGWWPETLEEAEKAAREYEWKMRDAIKMFKEKQAKAIENYERGADKAIYNYRRYVIGEYETGKEISVVPSSSEHHSMWLTLEQRKELEKKYGAVAVRWAEEATRSGDIKGVEAAAEYYYGKLKEVFGLGHLSPELTEQQIRRLREVLGLTADVTEVLKIHQETGYIP